MGCRNLIKNLFTNVDSTVSNNSSTIIQCCKDNIDAILILRFTTQNCCLLPLRMAEVNLKKHHFHAH